ncbi:putative extracellular serine-threonine rich protein [Phaeomoniella chlamydospora]|uniref:Putative extracellular serine-threonine rich protein n=1 Tax=Phaeomoniella chlamydospora TaxID=158046 RepID=A0A0G2GQF2_PHACM|nr:putative extracellular serine-threonine rich protein [Phaeomoniella chlamydospora]
MRFASIAAVAASLIASVTATQCATADLKGPTGNAITAPYKGQTLTMGTEFTITWTPSSAGPVELILLAGPTANNLTNIYTIEKSTPNNGSYTFMVPSASSGLASTTSSGYGIQLVDTTTCEYQFSVNFGIENPSAKTVTYTLVSGTSTSTVAASTSVANTTAVTAVVTAATGTGTGTAVVTSPVLSPSKSMTVPSSLKTTTTAVVAASTSTSASASASSATPTTTHSAGAAAPTGIVSWNAGALMVAGLVGALAL